MARFISHAHQVRTEIHGGAMQGMELAAEHLLQVSRGRVPLEEGTLERSGVASVDEAAGKAAVSFDTAYAVRQHEDLTFQHDDGRSAKYLEGPANEERATMLALIAQATRNRLH